MNVYDAARNLTRAIKDSEEYKQYEQMKATIEQNTELTNMLNDFHAKQMEMHTKQILGQEVGADFTAQIQQLYGIMMANPLAAQYLQAEMRFSVMMNDVYKILGEVINLGNNQ